MTHPTPTAPGWLEISIDAPPVVHEALNSFLFDLGCQGLVLAELPGLHLKGYLPAPFDTLSLKNQLELFKTDKITPKLMVVPVWEPISLDRPE